MHKKLFSIIGIFCMAALIQTGCTTAQNGSDAATYYEKDNGTTVQAAAGTTLKISLPTQPSTGFDWAVGPLAGFEQVGTGEYVRNSPPGMVGGVETVNMTFKALKAGKGSIVLHYKRAWEKDIPPIKTYTLKVEVK